MIISSKICCLALFLSWQGCRLLLHLTKLAAANSIFKKENSFYMIAAEQAVCFWILLPMNHYELTIMLAGIMRCDKNFHILHCNTSQKHKNKLPDLQVKILMKSCVVQINDTRRFQWWCVCVCVGGGGESTVQLKDFPCIT